MGNKYELHLEGKVFESESFSELKKLVEDKPHPYEIYLIKPSKMNSERFHTRKIDYSDVEKILRLISRGQTKESIAKLYHVNPQTLNRTIKAYQEEIANS